MKIKMKKDADYRVSPSRTQAYKAGRKYENVAKATAEALIARGSAEPVTDAQKEKTNG
jgi:hypothetical protein